MSFIQVSPENHFPIQNLPYGVFSTSDNVSKSREEDFSPKLITFLIYLILSAGKASPGCRYRGLCVGPQRDFRPLYRSTNVTEKVSSSRGKKYAANFY